MANIKKTVDDTLGTINSALTILDKYPKLVEGNGNLNAGVTLSPFSLLCEILKNYGGINYIIRILSDFMVFGIVPLEVAVKSYLILTFKNLLTCSLNPIIPNELLKYGLVFDLREIDIFNTLAVCPLDYTYGQYYYFGCEDATTTEDLRRSQDFNALLWYIVNRSSCRELWTICNSGHTDKILGSYQSTIYQNLKHNTSLIQNKVPLKDVSCVDIVIDAESITPNQITCQWDSSKVQEYTIDTQAGSIKDYLKKGDEVIKYDNNEKKYYFEYLEDDSTKKYYIQENDIIYDYKLKDGKLQLNEPQTLKVKKSTIVITDDTECYGQLDEKYYKNYQIDVTEYTNGDKKHYYKCDTEGFLIDDNNKRIVFQPTKKFKIKTNLFTGKLKTKTVNSFTVNNKAGIITLEYHENSNNVTDAHGNPLLNTHIPNNNALHVFIGNVQPKNYEQILHYRNLIDQEEKTILQKEQAIDDLNAEIEVLNNEINQLNNQTQTEVNTDSSNNEDKENEIIIKQKQITELNNNINSLRQYISNAPSIIEAYRTVITTCHKEYRNYSTNYYYKRTLLEFDLDYIWSLKLFDTKVLTAQLLDLTFNNLTINLGLTHERILLQNEIKEIVQSIIETDDAEVNDCFFSFSNEGYNNLLNQSEKIYQGLYSSHPNQEGTQLDVEDIFNQLNNISDDATPEEQRTVIEGIIEDIAVELNSVNTGVERNTIDIKISKVRDIGQDFIENLMTNLATSLSFIILSPKVYLLMAINMRIMGEQTNMDIETLISRMKKILTDLIRMIRDQLLEFITEKVMDLLKDLAKSIANKMSIEQAMYYYNTIRRLVDCFRNPRQKLGFTMENIGYADIYNQESTPPTTEC